MFSSKDAFQTYLAISLDTVRPDYRVQDSDPVRTIQVTSEKEPELHGLSQAGTTTATERLLKSKKEQMTRYKIHEASY